jgi:hypothetical protein
MMRRRYRVILLTTALTAMALLAPAVLTSGAAPGAKPEAADLVLTHGKIVTVDARKPEAQALAVRGGKIVAVGTDKEIQAYVGAATQVVDLAGALAIPGLIESHGHFMGLGGSKLELDLTKAKNWDDIVAMVGDAAKAAKPGEWIFGRGWHQDKWNKVPQPNINGLPFHDALSKASPENPVLLEHASGHSCLANAKAMELSGITDKTPDPPGGRIVRDGAGHAIGAFVDAATGLLRARTRMSPAEAQERERKEAELAAAECLANGVTTFHDAGEPFRTIDLFKKMADEGRLPVRLYVMMNANNATLKLRAASYRMIGAADNHLTVRSIKRLIDGALGSRSAWLLEPYADEPGSTGLNTEPIPSLQETAKFAIENGFQLCVHAIGDRANRETLDIYEAAFRAHPDKKDMRWRIEHAQHLNPVDIPRFGRLGVVAEMQAIHCSSDGPWVLKRLGAKRAEEGAYVWRKLIASGAVIANGTDVPVEPIDPMACFYAAVTRKMKDGTPFYPDQKMTREEALRSYTINGAFSAFEEDLKGSLSAGKLADVTVLSRDIMTCPEDEIPSTRVLYTIVGGKILYKRMP